MKKTLLPCLCLPIAAIALVIFEHDYLWQAQEQNLFLHTKLFFEQCMQVPGGLLSWAGAYLTQFFYYPLLGAGLLSLLWAFLILSLWKAFRINGDSRLLVLIPVAMLLADIVSQGYWIYFLKLRGHFFVPTLGMVTAAVLLWLFRLMPKKHILPTLFIVVSTLVSYPLFGAYGLLATALMAVSACASGKQQAVCTAIAAISIAAVPQLYYYTFYCLTPQEYVYLAALPLYVHNGDSDAWHYAPFAIFSIWMAAAAWLSLRPVSLRYATAVRRSLLAVTLLVTVLSWNTDDNLHREMTMRRQMEQLDWKGILTTVSAASGEPTRAMSMMKNLALQRQGRPADVQKYPDGFCRPRAAFRVHAVHTVGKMLYLQYGLPNYCYRWCMEDGVEYGWSVEKLKLMTKCSLLNGETEAAMRYLSLIRKTDFHRRWAEKYEAYVRQPALMARDAEFQGIFPLLRDDDFLTSDQSQLEPFLIEHLASSPGETPEQLELRNIYFKFYLNRNKYAEQ